MMINEGREWSPDGGGCRHPRAFWPIQLIIIDNNYFYAGRLYLPSFHRLFHLDFSFNFTSSNVNFLA